MMVDIEQGSMEGQTTVTAKQLGGIELLSANSAGRKAGSSSETNAGESTRRCGFQHRGTPMILIGTIMSIVAIVIFTMTYHGFRTNDGSTSAAAGGRSLLSEGGCFATGYDQVLKTSVCKAFDSNHWGCKPGAWGRHESMTACCAANTWIQPCGDGTGPDPTKSPTPAPTPGPDPTKAPTNAPTPEPTPDPTPAPTQQGVCTEDEAEWICNASFNGFQDREWRECNACSAMRGNISGKEDNVRCLRRTQGCCRHACVGGFSKTCTDKGASRTIGDPACSYHGTAIERPCGGRGCVITTCQCFQGWGGKQCNECSATNPTSAPTPSTGAPTQAPTTVIQRSKVVFRLDDVSDVWSTVNPALNKLIDTFVEAGVKLNAGIIGRSDLISSTGVVSSHLIKAMRQNNQAIEIFNHGPDSNAMTGHSAAVLKNKLDTSNGAIEQVFGVSKPTSFVPHQNRWDEVSCRHS